MAGSFLGEGGSAWGKEWAWARSGTGLGNRTFWTTTTFPRIVRSHHPLPPPPGGGWSRTQLPSEEEITGKSREIPSRKFTIPPRLVNSIFIFHCKPARKKFPKKLDKGGWGLYLCRWENGSSRVTTMTRRPPNNSNQTIYHNGQKPKRQNGIQRQEQVLLESFPKGRRQQNFFQRKCFVFCRIM